MDKIINMVTERIYSILGLLEHLMLKTRRASLKMLTQALISKYLTAKALTF